MVDILQFGFGGLGFGFRVRAISGWSFRPGLPKFSWSWGSLYKFIRIVLRINGACKPFPGVIPISITKRSLNSYPDIATRVK